MTKLVYYDHKDLLVTGDYTTYGGFTCDNEFIYCNEREGLFFPLTDDSASLYIAATDPDLKEDVDLLSQIHATMEVNGHTLLLGVLVTKRRIFEVTRTCSFEMAKEGRPLVYWPKPTSRPVALSGDFEGMSSLNAAIALSSVMNEEDGPPSIRQLYETIENHLDARLGDFSRILTKDEIDQLIDECAAR